MVINNGARRRTAGGVMLHLLRKTEDEGIKEKVKKFFNESQKNDHRRKIAVANKRKKKNFEKEMGDFLQARRELEEKHKEKMLPWKMMALMMMRITVKKKQNW